MMTFAVFYQGLLLFIFFRQENLFICTAPKQDSEEDTHSHYGSQLQIFIQVYQDPSLRKLHPADTLHHILGQTHGDVNLLIRMEMVSLIFRIAQNKFCTLSDEV